MIPEISLAQANFDNAQEKLKMQYERIAHLLSVIEPFQTEINQLEKYIDNELLPYANAIQDAHIQQQRTLKPWVFTGGTSKDLYHQRRLYVDKNGAWYNSMAWIRKMHAPNSDPNYVYMDFTSVDGKRYNQKPIRFTSLKDALFEADKILKEHGWYLL